MRAGSKFGGFVRKLDDLGRIVLPVEWRRICGIEPGDPMEIIPGRDGTLMLQRYVPGGTCTFCGESDQIHHFAGRPVCQACVARLGSMAQSPA